jgi:CheY-like chemotaxis protein
MIVDDVSTNLKLANTLIQKEYPNLRIISALNGMEAVQKFSLYKPGLILMDVHMPEMDGLEATAKIRQIEGESPEERTIIIAMTAAAFKEDRDKCFTAGMNDYVTKPIQAEKLSQALHKYLPAVKNNTNLLHFDQISMLEAFNGDRNFCREIITESLKNLTEHISIIESRPETEKIKLSAHSIKGLGLNIYCLELSEIAAKLQHEAETETEIKNLSNKIDLIKNEFARIKPLLLEFISS